MTVLHAVGHPSGSFPYGSFLTTIYNTSTFLETTWPKKNTLVNNSTFTSIAFKKNRYRQWIRKNIRDASDDQDDEYIYRTLREGEQEEARQEHVQQKVIFSLFSSCSSSLQSSTSYDPVAHADIYQKIDRMEDYLHQVGGKVDYLEN